MFILNFLKLLTDSRVERGHKNIDSRDTKNRQKERRDTDQRVREQRHRGTTEGTDSRSRRTDTDSRDIQRTSTGTRTHRIYPINLSADFAEVQYGRTKLIRISSFIFHCKYVKRTHMTISYITL
jgi:chromatin remodeling complex protein RSC6